MGPFAVRGVPHRGVQIVANHDVNRHAVAEGVVDRHRGVLQTYCAMGEYAERFSLHLGVAVGHRDRGFFMAAADEFGLAVTSIVNYRFMKSPEARTCDGADVFDAEGFQYVHHEVGPGAVQSEDFGIRGRIGFDQRRQKGQGSGGRLLNRLRGQSFGRCCERRCSGDHAFQEVSTPCGYFFGICHGSFSLVATSSVEQASACEGYPRKD